jgi:hypothetical protein
MNYLSRRHFLLTAGAAGAALLPSLVFSDPAQAAGKEKVSRIWNPNSADILIGNSPVEQVASPIITCPMFLPDGRFANASHTLDLSGATVTGNIAWDGDTISPDFSQSFAFSTATGSDGDFYLLTAGEGEVSGGEGKFRGVTQAIVRCKYQVDQSGLLVACDFCVAILVRD